MNWKNITSIEQLEQIDELSQKQPVLIFKHSTRCSISATALARMERKYSADDAPALETYFLDLIAHRDVSNAIASRYQVEHQSPQALLIQQGESVYDNSHLGISFEELVENIRPVTV
ncbi:MAG: bacillithiol system redox-active protein YtxJ [Marinoscillum sp.]